MHPFLWICIQKGEWISTTCNHALYAIIDVCTQYYDLLAPVLFDELITLIQWCSSQGLIFFLLAILAYTPTMQALIYSLL